MRRAFSFLSYSVAGFWIVVTLSACATITTGSIQHVKITTPYVKGASCILQNEQGGTWEIPETPMMATLPRGKGLLEVTCQKEGYQPATLTVREYMMIPTVANAVVPPGFYIDLVSGAMMGYPKEIAIWMEPLRWKTLAEKQLWLAEKEKYQSEYYIVKRPRFAFPPHVEPATAPSMPEKPVTKVPSTTPSHSRPVRITPLPKKKLN